MDGPPRSDRGDLVADLTRWLAEQRADRAADGRARERWLRQAGDEEMRVSGILLDLAERAGPVGLGCLGGRRHRGRVRAVGHDFVALGVAGGDLLVPYAAITAIRPDRAGPTGGGDRAPALDVTLAEALVVLAGDRRDVTVVHRDGTTLRGRLQASGRDVMAVGPPGPAPVVYVPLAAVAEVLAG